MHTKRVLLASSALALLAGATEAQADGLYISVLGGVNWVGDSSGSASTATPTDDYTQLVDWSVEADTGFVLGGAVGTHLDKWLKGLRVELEASYRRHDVNGTFVATFTTTGTVFVPSTSSGPIGGNLSTFALMANAWYEHDMGWKVRPYVGGGAGWGRTKFDAFGDGGEGITVDTENDGFAWQLGAGFNYQAMPGVDVGLGYRYFHGPEVNGVFTFNPFGGKAVIADTGRIENDNHAVMVNLTVDIN